jgi:oligosaccharide repeat unit polymerase
MLLTIVVILAAAAFLCDDSTEATVALLAVASTIIVTAPVLLGRMHSMFEPLTFAIILLLFGTPFKLIYIIADRYNSINIVGKLMNFEELNVFIQPLYIVTIAWLFFAVGYQLRLPGTPLAPLFLPKLNVWNERRLNLTMFTGAILSFAMFVGLIAATGARITNIEELSAKRFTHEGGESATRMTSSKWYLYRGAALSKFTAYFSLIQLLRTRRKWVSALGALCAWSIFQSAFVAFFMSNRAGIVLILLDCLVILYYVNKRLPLSYALAGGLTAMGIVIPMIALRDRGQFGIMPMIEKTAGGRDMLDITKTCHIINSVPSKMDYRYGEMFYGWLAAPIPASAWPNKPMWADRGVFINQHIFGEKYGLSGIPPGLIGELYWSFGVAGTWIGMFLFGLLLRQIYSSFLPSADNPSSILIYTIIATHFILFALGNDLGTGIVKTVLDLIPVVMILLLVGGVEKPVRN